MIRLGAGFLATLSAVLISLMIASAKTSYDTQAAHFRMLAAYLVETDQMLAQFGPETTQIRILMRQAVSGGGRSHLAREALGDSGQRVHFCLAGRADQWRDRGARRLRTTRSAR